MIQRAIGRAAFAVKTIYLGKCSEFCRANTSTTRNASRNGLQHRRSIHAHQPARTAMPLSSQTIEKWAERRFWN